MSKKYRTSNPPTRLHGTGRWFGSTSNPTLRRPPRTSCPVRDDLTARTGPARGPAPLAVRRARAIHGLAY